MKQLKSFLNQYKYYILGGILLFIIIVVLLFSSFNNKKVEKVEAINEIKTEENIEEKTEKEKTTYIKIDIKGEVINPGVYELEEGKRVIDSINKAGGLTKNADTSYLNLSKKLEDEMTIIVYSKEEIADMKEQESIIVYIEKECNCPSITNDACISDSGTNSTNTSNEKININTATIDELQTLTGIGESKAKSIVEYRETNGNFKNVEDIMNVSGIGESAYSKIKDNITV